MSKKPAFLENSGLELILFGGKGGVGKTSCASSCAVYLAQNNPENKYLLVSTDPAHSLSDSLNGAILPANLEVIELDAKSCLDKFKDQHGEKLHTIALRGTFLDDDDITKFLNLSLPGLDEIMAYLEISKWVEEKKYNCVLVDTAPTGHTLRLLEMPRMFRQWFEMLDTLLAKHRYMKKLFSGSYRLDEIDIFLKNLNSSITNLEKILHDSKRCAFVPVMIAEILSINETNMLAGKLKEANIPVSDLIINKIHPESDCELCQNLRGSQNSELKKHLFTSPLADYKIWGVPLYRREVLGLNSLMSFWSDVYEIMKIDEPRNLINLSPLVSGAGVNPFYMKLLLFAGKGGVGKTTLASATAMRLARDGRAVLLLSTDPAHSLTDALNMPIGDAPTPVCRNLSAMQINPQTEFDALKHEYRLELEKFLRALSSNLDLTFDREVMEKILDLAPPGLDEIMAITRALEIFNEKKYDILIIDSAPTGHLIRLLELPELIDQWLKVFFGLFIKYKNIFRLPGISAHLVRISKDLKGFRALLRDSDRAGLYAVTILTQMAYQETKDLAAACQRMGLNIPHLFLNLATPENGCDFCKEKRAAELEIKTKFEREFPNLAQSQIFRRNEPVGLHELSVLGALLYKMPQDNLRKLADKEIYKIKSINL